MMHSIIEVPVVPTDIQPDRNLLKDIVDRRDSDALTRFTRNVGDRIQIVLNHESPLDVALEGLPGDWMEEISKRGRGGAIRDAKMVEIGCSPSMSYTEFSSRPSIISRLILKTVKSLASQEVANVLAHASDEILVGDILERLSDDELPWAIVCSNVVGTRKLPRLIRLNDGEFGHHVSGAVQIIDGMTIATSCHVPYDGKDVVHVLDDPSLLLRDPIRCGCWFDENEENVHMTFIQRVGIVRGHIGDRYWNVGRTMPRPPDRDTPHMLELPGEDVNIADMQFD
jgi:hypothetical protein